MAEVLRGTPVKDVTWRKHLAEVRAEARRLRRPILIKPANQGINGEFWCPAASYARAVSFSDPRVSTFIEERFVPLLVSMVMVGDYQDAEGRDLVLRYVPTAPLPGVLVVDPDELNLLAKTEYTASPEHTLQTLKDVLIARPDLASGAPVEVGDPYDRTDPIQAALLDLQERLTTATEEQARHLCGAIERWLSDHGDECVQAAPLAMLLLGQARYLSADFDGASAIWDELKERFPTHPLRHRASYYNLDPMVWPDPVHPSVARARHANVGDHGVLVPNPQLRTQNLELVRTDPRYRFSPSGLPFVVIPAGTFIMGSDPPSSPREHLLRRVTITRPFLLAAWPVTRSLWRRVFPDVWPGVESEGIAGELPATHVSWNQCAEFIDLLRSKDGWPYRFPTEAEWEYAARDGLEQAAFPWGNEPIDASRGNFSLPRPVPVGCYPPTRWGLFDVLGNVCEYVSDLWTADGYSSTPYEVVDPQGPLPEEQPAGTRVLMPSACGSPLWEIHARIGWRGVIPPDWATGSFALRLACDL